MKHKANIYNYLLTYQIKKEGFTLPLKQLAQNAQ